MYTCIINYFTLPVNWPHHILWVAKPLTTSRRAVSLQSRQLLTIRRSKLHYTTSGIITHIGGRLVHRSREDMSSKHVEAWNKRIVKQTFCASSWLITEINIPTYFDGSQSHHQGSPPSTNQNIATVRCLSYHAYSHIHCTSLSRRSWLNTDA